MARAERLNQRCRYILDINTSEMKVYSENLQVWFLYKIFFESIANRNNIYLTSTQQEEFYNLFRQLADLNLCVDNILGPDQLYSKMKYQGEAVINLSDIEHDFIEIGDFLPFCEPMPQSLIDSLQRIKAELLDIRASFTNGNLTLEKVKNFDRLTRPYVKFFTRCENIRDKDDINNWQEYIAKVQEPEVPHCFDKFYRAENQNVFQQNAKRGIFKGNDQTRDWSSLDPSEKAWFCTLDGQLGEQQYDRLVAKTEVHEAFPLLNEFYGYEHPTGTTPLDLVSNINSDNQGDYREYYFLEADESKVNYFYCETIKKLGFNAGDVPKGSEFEAKIAYINERLLKKEKIQTKVHSQDNESGLMSLLYYRTFEVKDSTVKVENKVSILISDESLFRSIMNSDLSKRVAACYDLGEIKSLAYIEGMGSESLRDRATETFFSNKERFFEDQEMQVRVLQPNQCQESKIPIYLGMFQLVVFIALALTYSFCLLAGQPFWGAFYAVNGWRDSRVIMTFLLGAGSLVSGIYSAKNQYHLNDTWFLGVIIPVVTGLFLMGFSWHVVAYAPWWQQAQIAYQGMTDYRILLTSLFLLGSGFSFVKSLMTVLNMNCFHACMKRLAPELFDTEPSVKNSVDPTPPGNLNTARPNSHQQVKNTQGETEDLVNDPKSKVTI